MISRSFISNARKLWHDRATIYAKVESSDGVFDTVENKKIADNEPCKVVIKAITPVNSDSGVGETQYTSILHLRPDISIPDGAVIDVRDVNNNVTHYKKGHSYDGYANHQEVALIHDEKTNNGDD